jgi:[ribosomal protein S18]-alanine N-acetyltransferase
MSAIYTIRMAEGGDLDEILKLQSRCTQVLNWSEVLWQHLLQDAVTNVGLRCVWVAVTEREVVGFAVLGGAAGFAELEMVLVAADMREQGIGRALCRYAMRWAAERGAATVELEVRASNRAAVALYESLGFARQGVRRDYYREPVEDAVLMACVLQIRELQLSKV